MNTVTACGVVSEDQIEGSERKGSLLSLEVIIMVGESPLTSWIVVSVKFRELGGDGRLEEDVPL